MSFKKIIVITICIFASGSLYSNEERSEVPEVIVTPDGKFLGNQRSYTTGKIDVLKKDRIEKSSLTSLNEAMNNMPGIDSQDYCVNCGAKRISINGLRGDHTSVLIDDIPLYSAVTSVYGFDAISMQSVEEIEVKRGTGGALLNPEAIGGSINIITLDPQETKTRASLFVGDQNTKTYELLHNHVFDNYKISVGGEFNRQDYWDVDNNDFAESPFKSRYSLFLKQILNLSPKTRWESRLSFADMEIIGGNTSRLRISSATDVQANDFDFEDGDVRKQFIGDKKSISEYVVVKRTEATSKLRTMLNENNSLEWNLAGAIYDQESYYIHGYDYSTNDLTLYSDLRWNSQRAKNKVMTLGLSVRKETLRSDSIVMYDLNNVAKDDFDFSAYSLFGKYEWFFENGIEVSTALRIERLENNWLELSSLKKNMASPRLLVKWQHSEHFSQQFAYGYGYRMPLTSIESAHGAYDGFEVGITELEKSHSLVYSLSYNTPKYYITPSAHYTHLENMSYPVEPAVAHSGPLLFKNDTNDHDIFVYDVLVGYKPTLNWLLEVGYEKFNYTDSYKAKLPTAAIENRVNVRSEYERGGYSFILIGSWVGSRDISKYYQYDEQYNVSDGLFGVSDPKRQQSPSYWQWDSSLTKKVKNLDLTVGVQNIFDYTQTKKGDSPAMWHSHDSHTHLDNRHVWGPNRGREFYLKMSYSF